MMVRFPYEGGGRASFPRGSRSSYCTANLSKSASHPRQCLIQPIHRCSVRPVLLTTIFQLPLVTPPRSYFGTPQSQVHRHGDLFPPPFGATFRYSRNDINVFMMLYLLPTRGIPTMHFGPMRCGPTNQSLNEASKFGREEKCILH